MSGRKNFISGFQLESAKSLGTSFQLTPQTLTTVSRLGFSVSTSGVTDNTGVFGVQHRVYKDENNKSDWVDLTLDSDPTLADEDDQFLIDVSVPPGQVRLVFTQAQAEVQTLTFPTKAGATDGDYIIVTDGSGLEWGIALDTTGAAANTPTGAAWVAVPAGRKAYVDISGAVTAANVAAAVEVVFDALSGLTAAMTTDDTAADGTMILTMLVAGNVADPSPHNKDDSGVGTITGVETSGPDGVCAVWISGSQEG